MHDRRCFPVKTNKNIKKIHWPRGKFYGNALARNVLTVVFFFAVPVEFAVKSVMIADFTFFWLLFRHKALL